MMMLLSRLFSFLLGALVFWMMMATVRAEEGSAHLLSSSNDEDDHPAAAGSSGVIKTSLRSTASQQGHRQLTFDTIAACLELLLCRADLATIVCPTSSTSSGAAKNSEEGEGGVRRNLMGSIVEGLLGGGGGDGDDSDSGAGTGGAEDEAQEEEDPSGGERQKRRNLLLFGLVSEVCEDNLRICEKEKDEACPTPQPTPAPVTPAPEPVPTAAPITIQPTTFCIGDEDRLRQAISNASTDPQIISTLVLCGNFQLTQDIVLDGKYFDLSCAITPSCQINGNEATRFFRGAPGKATFNDIVLLNGKTSDSTPEAQGGNRGGAVYATGGTWEFVNSNIVSNKARRGAALYMTTTGSNSPPMVTFTGSFLNANQSIQQGGVAYVEKGTLSLDDCIVSGNTANSSGGAIYVRFEGSLTISTDVEFLNNMAGGSGGAIFIDNAAANIQKSIFNGNTVTVDSGDGGGAIAVFFAEVTMAEVVFTGNTAPNGDDIWIGDDSNPVSNGSNVNCADGASVIFCNGLNDDTVFEFGGTTQNYANTDCSVDGSVGTPGVGSCPP